MWGDSLELVTRSSKDINSRIRQLKTQGAPSWCNIVGTAYENMERVVQHLEAALKMERRTSTDKDIEEIVKKCETMSVEKACEGKSPPVRTPKKAKRGKKLEKVEKPAIAEKPKKVKKVKEDKLVLSEEAKAIGWYEASAPPVVIDARRMDLEKPWYVEFLGANIFFSTRDGARYYANILRKAESIKATTRDQRGLGIGWVVETVVTNDKNDIFKGKAVFKRRDDARSYASRVRNYKNKKN